MAFGRQFRTTRADNRLRPDYVASLNKKLEFLPHRLAQQRAEEQHQDQVNYQNRSLIQAQSQFKRQMAMQEREQQAAMGLEAGKAGLGFALKKGGKNLGSYLSPGGPSASATTFSPRPGGMGGMAAGSGVTGVAKPGGLFSGFGALKESANKYLGHLNLGNTVGSGLLGFGAGSLLGGDNKLKKFAVGAGAAGLASLFGGGGGSAAEKITSGLFGGLGGLFS
jgi:hypothetical protein